MQSAALAHSELSHTIIGSAMAVLNALKPRLSEKAYENALAIELRHRGFEVQQQRRYDVYYRDQLVDVLIPDLLVNDLVIVDPKIVEEFNSAHVAQMTGYLAVTNLKLALLLNFKHGDLRWKRVVR
jgi:GxxExxY protein